MYNFYKPESIEYVQKILREVNIMYASMEIAVHPEVHTYSGGLGVLAGDTLRSCADLGVPIAALTLIHHRGYFKQVMQGFYQTEAEEPWDVDEYTVALPDAKATVQIEGRTVYIQPRIGIIVGKEKHIVPIIFLDAGIDDNDVRDRSLTDHLYAGDNHMRLKQEAILGIGGKRVIRKLGLRNVHTFHMNEGHAAFAPIEDVQYLSKYYSYSKPLIHQLVRSKHVFTTHTPVPAGHDRFSYEVMRQVLAKDDFAWSSIDLAGHSECNMTQLALSLSRFANGVAKKHGEISRRMFPGYKIDSITNGIHLTSWMCPEVQAILNKVLPAWKEQPSILNHCYQVINPNDLYEAHKKSKQRLLDFIKERTGRELCVDCLTIGFARRFATYKRADLMFKDVERLKKFGGGKLQFVFAGEAHPRDEQGKEIIRHVMTRAQELQGTIEIVFLEDYGMEISKLMVAGCDLWQNNPVPPMEASGTSGMKAAANGVPNLSTLDGWWIEGIANNPQGGWVIKHQEDGNDALPLYDLYEHIIRVFYNHPRRWKEHMVHALSLAAYFNTHRMVNEYVDKAWSLDIY